MKQIETSICQKSLRSLKNVRTASRLRKLRVISLKSVLSALVLVGASTNVTAAQATENQTKHCVAEIEVTYRDIFMMDNWLPIAKEKATKSWQSKVQNRYGSVYSIWAQSEQKKSKCLRIGFGNDPQGNIGTTVTCVYAAKPCVIITKKSVY